jgi:hypothetical protein
MRRCAQLNQTFARIRGPLQPKAASNPRYCEANLAIGIVLTPMLDRIRPQLRRDEGKASGI